ncbi:thioredoxin domain-containing protein [Terricaulis silvestris]|nr:thioredoxin domain-containing protein [Terricaulis silvestris]
MTLGDASAPAQLVEYASLTCPHCAAFHAEVFPRIKAEYIDARRIGFTLREFPTPPMPVSFAMFQLARCGGANAETYFDRVGILFQEQRAVLSSGTGEGVRAALINIGARWGLSEDQVVAAMMDQEGVTRVTATVEDGHQRFDVHGTPALVLNDRLLEGPTSLTYAGLSATLNAALS